MDHLRRRLLGGGLIIAILCTAVFLALHRDYLSLSLVIIASAFIPLFIRFERRKLKARELVLLAVLGALAAVSRLPFAAIPSVQPTTFVIIVSGLVFGAESGFVIGCLAALVSNLVLGQGPWTPWQMISWGLIGGGAGVLSHFRMMRKVWAQCLFGLFSGYFFGWMMNVWSILSLHLTGLKTWLSMYAASFYFDSAHALSNVILLALFSKSWVKILERFKIKYGLLDVKKEG